MKTARPEDKLMQGVAKNLLMGLGRIASQGVVEITRLANQLGVSPEYLPYVFWALDTKSALPRMSKDDQAAFDLMLTAMRGTGSMPTYQSSFTIADDEVVDQAVSSIALHMGRWAKQTMMPLVRRAYLEALKSQVGGVPRATGGRVPLQQAFTFLSMAFPQVLSMESRSFSRGELLRRVVRTQTR